MENIPKETLNCRMNNKRLESLEEGMKVVINRVEKVDDRLDLEVDRQVEYMELVAKLDTVVEYMVKDREQDRVDQKELNKSFINTLGNMNANLTELNGDVKYVISDNKKIKQELGVMKNTQIESNKVGTIDLKSLSTKVVAKVIEYLMYGGILFIIAKVILGSGIGQ